MSGADQLPIWVALLVALLTVGGAFLTMLGCLGLARFRSFYERLHAPTLGMSFGTVGILLGSALLFTATEQRFVAREILIFVFVTVTTPVTLMLLARAALYRDRVEGNEGVPGPG